MGEYAPTIRKNIFKMSKNSKQKVRMYILIFYVNMLSFAENRYFYVLCKNDKKIVLSMSILASNLSFVRTTQKMLFCREITL
jgi:hypothetical protein